MTDTQQFRLFDDLPMTGHTLAISGTIQHVEDKPADRLKVLTSGVALVRYRVAHTKLGEGKIGVGLAETQSVVIDRLYPMADQGIAKRIIDEMRAEVRAELDRRHAAVMAGATAELAAGSAECESGPDEDEFDVALRLAQ